MLSFWILAAILSVITVLAVARPLLRRGEAVAEQSTPRAAADVAVYRERIAEIEAELVRGLISAQEAEAARIEIARRLLASSSAEAQPDKSVATASSSDRTSSERAFMIVACAIPAIALGFYTYLGSPALPGRPVAERLAKAPGPGADVEELIARVEARLRADPRDGQGWDVLAPVYLRLERYQEAADAFQRAIDTLGETTRRLSGLAESNVLANDGIVTETARKAYKRILEFEPGRPDAQFGLALAKEQEGDLDEAEAAYRQLAQETPPQAPWRAFLLERLEAIEERRGGSPKPDEPAAEAIAGLPEAQRRQVIQQMVEGLAERLKVNGRDLDGWQKLVRSWTVLGDKDKAEAALLDARKALSGDDKALSELDALAKGLGLKS
jgi:cytochrome c-type biogenesis protein CcmH